MKTPGWQTLRCSMGSVSHSSGSLGAGLLPRRRGFALSGVQVEFLDEETDFYSWIIWLTDNGAQRHSLTTSYWTMKAAVGKTENVTCSNPFFERLKYGGCPNFRVKVHSDQMKNRTSDFFFAGNGLENMFKVLAYKSVNFDVIFLTLNWILIIQSSKIRESDSKQINRPSVFNTKTC